VFGGFNIQAFQFEDGKDHVAVFTDDFASKIPLIRLHSECLTGDALGSMRCDCRDQLALALTQISEYGSGMLLYLRQEGRGIGLFNKINAYNLQDSGLDTYAANHQLGFGSDERDFSIAQDILNYYNIKEAKLLTNNPKKISFLSNLIVTERVPLVVKISEHNKDYIAAKKAAGHLF
jgi:GTP cyclohydrolase II